MDDDGLVIAVRLSDIDEKEQPDPLCLRLADLETWRHFESLLCDMYKSPPDAVKVAYLDDENDWVELSSDAELQEAVKLTKSSGEILQLIVKRVNQEKLREPGIDMQSVQTAAASQPIPIYYVPTTDPGGDVFQQLKYPYPAENDSHHIEATAPMITEPHILVYPYPEEDALAANFKTLGTTIQLGHYPRDRLTKLPIHEQPVNGGTSQLQAPIAVIPWDKAESLSTEKKMYYLKTMLASATQQYEQEQAEAEKLKEAKEVSLLEDFQTTVNVEPLCSEPGSLGQNFVTNQDPFELECDPPGREETEKSLLTLIPTSAAKDASIKEARNLTSQAEGSSNAGSLLDLLSTVHSALSFIPTPQSPPITTGVPAYTAAIPKCKLTKKVNEVGSVTKPLPRDLMMMEGAQSGANAVAIEMPPEPEFFHNVNKDEEIAASGGASSTSASEETGEVLTRAGSDAAAVCREMRAFPQPVEPFGVQVEEALPRKIEKKLHKSGEVKTKTSSCKKEKSSSKDKVACEKKEKSEERKERSGEKKKKFGERKEASEDRKEPSRSKARGEKVKATDGEKRSSEGHHKDSSSRRKSEDKKVVMEDVESGEKVRVRTESLLKKRSFIRFMEQMKTEMHQMIAQDVRSQTETLMQALRSTQTTMVGGGPTCIKDYVIHIGIYCDHCNNVIQGIRYKCGNCLDFDLCEACEAMPNFHDPTHVFLKLRYPARMAGCLGNFRAPLLRENIYLAAKPDVPQAEENTTTNDIVREPAPKIIEIENQTEEISEVNHQPKYTSLKDLQSVETAEVSSLQEVVPLCQLTAAIPTSQKPDPASPASSDSSDIVSIDGVDSEAPLMDSVSLDHFTGATAISFDKLIKSQAQRPVSPNQPIFLDMDGDSSFQEWDSDTSDDFCIIERSHMREESYEALPGDDIEVPQNQETTEQIRPDEATSLMAANLFQSLGTMALGNAETEETPELDQQQSVESIESIHSIQDLVHSMNEEEKTRYKQMFQEQLQEEEVRKKELEKQNRELEIEILQREQEFQAILEAKEREAALINRTLEEGLTQNRTLEEGLTQNRNLGEGLTQKQIENHPESVIQPPTGVTRSLSYDDSLGKKDADCQTNPEVHAASHIIHNVATGVSKAAASAYYTAKDVFYSLQAKQNEWKYPVSTYRPPQSNWTLPADTYVPPTAKWVPPETGDMEGTKMERRLSTPHPTKTLMEGSDSEVTRELKSMQHLIEMGFANRERNRQLLAKFNGDLEKVVQSLLQEETDHWALSRH